MKSRSVVLLLVFLILWSVLYEVIYTGLPLLAALKTTASTFSVIAIFLLLIGVPWVFLEMKSNRKRFLELSDNEEHN